MPKTKRVYTFGNKQAEGNGKMRVLLGGKGANLAEMTGLGLPVPPGFTISTEACNNYYENDKTLDEEITAQAMAALEDPVTGAEAAVMLQNILDLPVESTLAADAKDGGTEERENDAPAWAKHALAALAAQDVTLNANEKLTRGRAAQILYRVDALYDTAPGTAVFRQTEDNNKF